MVSRSAALRHRATRRLRSRFRTNDCLCHGPGQCTRRDPISENTWQRTILTPATPPLAYRCLVVIRRGSVRRNLLRKPPAILHRGSRAGMSRSDARRRPLLGDSRAHCPTARCHPAGELGRRLARNKQVGAGKFSVVIAPPFESVPALCPHERISNRHHLNDCCARRYRTFGRSQSDVEVTPNPVAHRNGATVRSLRSKRGIAHSRA